ncbi:alpha/beta hydrolase [Clostridium rectalis]|uniref:alpha/beta hydrolase n=1 Tax=Clostridium rectalis TaxID=2040295 RepID=UPI001FAA1258|nr:alpha/beta hydrolase [Clostridium rectalis]
MKKKKILIGTISLILIILVSIISIPSLYAANLLYNGVCKISIDKNLNKLEENKYFLDYNNLIKLHKEEVCINSKYGYKLYGTYFKNSKNTNKTVIIVHGFMGSRINSLKYADMYLKLGFNTFIYDSRYHGKSGGEDISLGYYERYDLDSCVKWVNNKVPNGTIGVHGESLGGATALLHSKINEKDKLVSFYVSDCSYSNLKKIYEREASSKLGIKTPLIANIVLFYTNIISLYKSGFSLYSISPKESIKNVSTPIMFIHGNKDEFIPTNMAYELYNEKKGQKAIYICANAKHAQSYIKNKGIYIEKVEKFFNIGIIK